MNKPAAPCLKFFGFSWSGRAMIALAIAWLPFQIFLFLLSYLSIVLRLPSYFDHILLCIFCLPPAVMLVLALLSLSCIACMEPDKITLRFLGVPIRRLRVSDISLLCAVGNDRDCVLCFAARPVGEMAEIMERTLLKSWLLKHDAARRRRLPDWQDAFARDYLIRLMNSMLGLFRSRDVIMLPMNPTCQYLLRAMYPHLPYKNYTGVSARPDSYRYGSIAAYQYNIPSAHNLKFTPEGIHLFRDKKYLFLLPSEQIKTVVRVDLFHCSNQGRLSHVPLLMVSRLSESELAALAPKRLTQSPSNPFPVPSELFAVEACCRLARRWSPKNQSFIPIACTQKTIDSLRSLCPHARWIDLSNSWLINSQEEVLP